MDKLNAITLFCRVVETQSFTQASQQLNISVAMASKLVSQLEEQLKTRLLQRTTRKIMPTEAGQIYYQRCLGILLELEEAEASITNHATALQGKLMVSVPRDFGLRFITPNLANFVQQHPNLHLQIEYTDRKVDLIAEGYDLALRIGSLTESSLVAKKIATSTMHIVGSPDYFSQYGMPKTPEALSEHACLIYNSPNNFTWELVKDKQVHRIRVNPKLISNNGNTLTQLATAGLGLINSPRFLIEEELQSGKLIEVLSDYSQNIVNLNVLYPHRRFLPLKVRAFIDFLTELELCNPNN